MLPKIIIVAVLVVLGIFIFEPVRNQAMLIFGLVSKGGFGSPPSGFPKGVSESKPLPECPNPLILQTPVDINKVTSILYPGQERGGDFKPHGGFRFDNSKNDDIEVKVPMDAILSDASRYTEQGEIQYTLDFQIPCGIRYRLGHLLTLTPKFAKIVEGLPEPKEGDSRTSQINPEVTVTEGEIIATAVGLRNNNNVFVDFGVYDLRGRSRDFQDTKQSAICWFDLLPPADAAKVKSLPPADSVSGSKSTYCKS